MNQPDPALPVDDALIDRMVDGGMTPGELRAAALRLDRDAGGWKRCALAFVEAQVLNESLRALDQADRHHPHAKALPLISAAPKPDRHRWLRSAAAAAIVVSSFAMGWIVRETWPTSRARDSLALDTEARRLSSQSGRPQAESTATPGDAPDQDSAFQPAEPDATVRAVATIRFGPENSPAEVPVFAGPGITEDWLVQQPPPVSEYRQVALARQGYQVDQQRSYFTAILADGRRVAVPVDHVRIQYTGNEPL